jgi:hypothetical protein
VDVNNKASYYIEKKEKNVANWAHQKKNLKIVLFDQRSSRGTCVIIFKNGIP